MSSLILVAALPAPARLPFRAPHGAAVSALGMAAWMALGALPLAASAQSAPPLETSAHEAELPAVTVQDRAERPNGTLNLGAPAATGSRLGLTVRDTPAAVTVVDRATIEERGATNTQEMLKSIPGVTAHDAPGNVGVSWRGFGGSSLNQLFNGINVQYGIAARPVDSWIYDRVEAIGGASSFLYGAGGGAGRGVIWIIYIVSRKLHELF